MLVLFGLVKSITSEAFRLEPFLPLLYSYTNPLKFPLFSNPLNVVPIIGETY